MALAEELALLWRSRLKDDCPDQPTSTQESIVQWLLGENQARYEDMDSAQLAVAKQAMDYRYRILLQRYLSVRPELAHRNLIQRLSSLFLIRSKIRTWVSLSRDRHRSVTEVLQEVIHELIQSDTYIRQQMFWIAQCTENPRLRNSMMLASVEEYCLRPIRNQPLLVYRFVNYLRRTQRGGMTQVPASELVRLVSEEVAPDETENPVSLLDNEALTRYQDQQAWEEQQTLRSTVQQEFSDYLAQEVDPVAAEWLALHLKGMSQEAIAKTLNRPIREIYRLREKISYHAMHAFSLKNQPELVMAWLGTSLDQNLGLTLSQWEAFIETLTPQQQIILQRLKKKIAFEAIAQEIGAKMTQVASEWSKIYLAAQTMRGDNP